MYEIWLDLKNKNWGGGGGNFLLKEAVVGTIICIFGLFGSQS